MADVKINYKNTIYNLVLLLVVFLVWRFMYIAQDYDYDDNYGCIISAVMLSFVACFSMLVLRLTQKELVLANKWQSIVFLVLASPLTVMLVAGNYYFLFGVHLNDGR